MNLNDKNTNSILAISFSDDFRLFEAVKATSVVSKNEEDALNTIKINLTKYNLIILSEEVALALEGKLDKYKKLTYPIFLVLPTTNSATKLGLNIIKSIAKDALGLDILKE